MKINIVRAVKNQTITLSTILPIHLLGSKVKYKAGNMQINDVLPISKNNPVSNVRSKFVKLQDTSLCSHKKKVKRNSNDTVRNHSTK